MCRWWWLPSWSPATVAIGCRGFCLTAQGASEAAGFVWSSAPLPLGLTCGGLVVVVADGGGGCQELLVVVVGDVLHFGLG